MSRSVSPGMMWQMMHFEWRWQLRRPLPLAIAVVLVLMAVLMIRQGLGAEAVNINSPYAVMQSWGLLSLWFLATQTIFVVHGALRDDEHRTFELLASRPVSSRQLVITRIAGIVGSGAVVAAAVLLVQLVAPFAVATDPGRVGPLRPAAYVWTFGTLVLPNLLLVSAVLYAIAIWSRRTMATYVGAIGIFAVYMVVALLTDSPLMANSAPPSPEALARAAILDPLGTSAFFEATRYWTPLERNTQLVPLAGHYLLNRLLWCSAAIVALLVTARRSPLVAPARGSHRRRTKARWFGGATPGEARPVAMRSDAALVARPATTSRASTAIDATAATATGWRGAFAAFWQATRMETRLLFGSWMVQVLAVLFGATMAIEAMSALASGEYGTRLLATSGVLLRTLAQPLELIATLTVVYFAAEVVWRERLQRVDGLVDCTPVSAVVLYFAKLATLMCVPLFFAAVGMLVLVALQWTSGQEPVVWSAHLGIIAFTAVPVMLRAVVLLGLQVLSPNRWIGLVAGVAVMVVTVGGGVPGLQHPLLRYSVMPDVSYSDLDGFGATTRSFAIMAAYWTTWAVAIATLTAAVWPRGVDGGLIARIRTLLAPRRGRVRGSARVVWTLAASAAIAGAAGGAVYRSGRANSDWMSPGDRTAWRVAYERAYRRVQEKPQPSIVSVTMDLDLDTEERRAAVHGRLTLENRTTTAIDSIWVAPGLDLVVDSLRLSGADVVRRDSAYNTWVVALRVPLDPGQSQVLEYGGTLDRGAFRLAAAEPDVATNGTYIMSTTLLPVLGYRPSYEEQDPRARTSFALGAPTRSDSSASLSAVDSLTAMARRGDGVAWFTLDLDVATAVDQTVVGPGTLAATWTTGDRRHFRYTSTAPMTPVFALASARYDVRKARAGAVEVEAWFHPGHERNVDHMLATAQRALEILQERFGPYRLPVLRMAEVPLRWRFGAYATTGALFFTEDRGMLTDMRDGDVDLVARRVAHEVAHQWWGHTVRPLPVAGGRILVESLAKYCEQVVVAAMHGDDAVLPILAYDHDRYLAGRAREARREPALFAMTDQSYLDYGKGALAFAALAARLGDSTMTTVLSSVLASDGGPQGAATASMLHERLRRAAPGAELRALVDEWMLERVVYDMRVDSARAHAVPGGYRADVVARVSRLVHVDDAERVFPANGTLVDVVLRDVNGGVLARDAIRAVDGFLRWSHTVAKAPAEVAIDPTMRWIDRERSNNRMPVLAHTER